MILKKAHAYLQFITETPVQFQNNLSKTVGGGF